MQADDASDLALARRTIPALVLAAADRYGDRSALEDGEKRFTFSELAAAGLEATRAFCAAGMQPGDRVAIWAPNIAEWVVAAIGLQGAGCVLVALSTRLKGGEATYQLQKSRARLLLTVGDFLGVNYAEMLRDADLPHLERTVTLQGAGAGAQPWAEFLAGAPAFPLEHAERRALAVSPDDISDMLFTSGTTGNPKGVITSHGQNIRTFEIFTSLIGLRPGDRYLIVNAFFHSFGYKAGWLSCILRGATAIPHAVFDVSEVLTRIGNERITVLPGPPTLYQSLLVHPDLGKYDISSLRMCTTGAAPTPVELIHRMRNELGFDTIITAYGLTETCGVVTMCRADDNPETIATTSGRAIPDVEVRCVDPEGNEVPRGEPGEVLVRGYNVMQGYFEDPEETARTIDAEGFVHTGDIAVMDERGYVRITDRIKDMYILGGFNCYPAEIENILYSSGHFAQVAVIGIPDERQGEVGMAFVVPAPGVSLSEESVIAWSRQNMANYKVPRRVEIVDELPLNASGKVMKFVLRERARQTS